MTEGSGGDQIRFYDIYRARFISEYAQQPNHYLTSNSTLLLLPGDNALSVNFAVKNVSHFEIEI